MNSFRQTDVFLSIAGRDKHSDGNKEDASESNLMFYALNRKRQSVQLPPSPPITTTTHSETELNRM